MAEKIIKGILLGIGVGILGYLVLRDITAAIFLGGIWFLAMLVPKKKG